MKLKTLLCSMLCLVSMTSMAINENKIYGSDLTITKGTTTGTFYVYLNNSNSICGFQFDIYVPTGVSVKKGRSSYTITKSDSRFEGSDHSVSSSLQSDGSIRVLVASATNTAIWDETEEGVDIRTTDPVLTVTLAIDAEETSGAYDIMLKNIVLSQYTEATNTTTKYVASDNASTILVKPASGIEESISEKVASFATADGSTISKTDYQTYIADNASSITGIDLRASALGSDIKSIDDLKASGLGDNVVYLLPEGSSITGDNVIVDHKCDNLKITDGSSFSTPVLFNAANASYSRTMDTTWGTICLPYDIASDASAAYYKITELNAGVLSIEKYETLPAGTPALVKKLSGSEIAPQATSVAVSGDLNNVSGTVKMYGSYTNQVRVEDANAYYIYDNKFYSCNEYFYCNAFRGYFTVEGGGAKVLTIDDDLATVIDNLTSNDIEAVYDVNGINRSDIQKGLNIVKLTNGKTQKIIVK